MIHAHISCTDGRNGKNVTIFGVDDSSSVHIDGKKKNVLVLVEGSTKCLEDATITVVAKCHISFTEWGKDLY